MTDVSSDDLAIRARPRPVKRFNRKTLIGTVSLAALLVMGAAGFALRSPPERNGAARAELYNTTNKPMPDAFNALPTSYAEMPPELGPPLPGDLGAAFIGRDRVEAPTENPFQFQPQASNGRSYSSSPSASAADARGSKLFFIDYNNRDRRSGAGNALAAEPSAPSLDQLAQFFPQGGGANVGDAFGFDADPNRQQRKEGFLGAKVDTKIYNAHQLQAPISPYQVMAGTIIPASLITGLNSDLPGQVIAQVTENVYDTATGAYLLVPQGSRLIGKYDSVIAYGQSRALVVWSRIIMPDGTSITIENLPGVDLAGYAGIKDKVDYHSWKLFQAAILSSVLSVASEIGRDSDDDQIIEALRDGGQRTINQAGQQIVTKQLAVQPTITIRPGWRLRVIVNKDLVLQPYGG